TGVALPTGTSLLQVAAKIPPLRGAVLTAVVEDTRGRISDLELHPAHPDSYEGPAPGATRLLSIVLTVPFFPGTNQPSAVPITSTFTGITAVAADGPVAIPLDEWQALVPDGEVSITPGGAVELTFHPFE